MDTDWQFSSSKFIDDSVLACAQISDSDFYNVFLKSLNDTLNSPRPKLENSKPIMYWTHEDCNYLMELVRMTPDIVDSLPLYKVASNPEATESFYATLKQIADVSRKLVPRQTNGFPVLDDVRSLPWQTPGWELSCGKWISAGREMNSDHGTMLKPQYSGNKVFQNWFPMPMSNGSNQGGLQTMSGSTNSCLPGFATALFLMNHSKTTVSLDGGHLQSGQSSGFVSKQASPREQMQGSGMLGNDMQCHNDLSVSLKTQNDFFLNPLHRESEFLNRKPMPLMEQNMNGRHMYGNNGAIGLAGSENPSQLLMPAASRRNSGMLIKNNNYLISANEDCERHVAWTNPERFGPGRYWPRAGHNAEEFHRAEQEAKKSVNCGNSYFRASKPLAQSRHSYYVRENEGPKTDKNKSEYICVFCKGNEEKEEIYTSHPLRLGNIVICPSLRNYTCFICKATGDNAHTIKYCPFNKRGYFATRSHEKCNSRNRSRTKMKIQVIDELPSHAADESRDPSSQFIRDAKRNIDMVLRHGRISDGLGSETDDEKWDSDETDVSSEICA